MNVFAAASERQFSPTLLARAGVWAQQCQRVLSQHRALSLTLLLMGGSLIAAIDHAAGDDVPLMLLYLPVVIAACWLQHISIGVVLSLICSALWLVDDLLLIEQAGVSIHKYWLAVVHLVFFSVVALMTWRLRLAQERQRRLARTDALTQLANRKAFLEAARREIARAKRSGKPLAVAYFDCDNFKEVNDSLGHAAGDALLVAVAKTARANVRPTDVMARLGGDEFACLLPEADQRRAGEVVRRLQQRLDATMCENDWPVTFSIGLAVFTAAPEDADQLIGIADELMYAVKSREKNALLMRSVPPGQADDRHAQDETHEPEPVGYVTI